MSFAERLRALHACEEAVTATPVTATPVTATPTLAVCTREICQRCHSINVVGFGARDEIWQAVAGRHWKDSILCLACFAQLGDEKLIKWEADMTFYPVSLATSVEDQGRDVQGQVS